MKFFIGLFQEPGLDFVTVQNLQNSYFPEHLLGGSESSRLGLIWKTSVFKSKNDYKFNNTY